MSTTSGGAELIALAADGGQRIGSAHPGADEGRLVGAPVALSADAVAVARQAYSEGEAALVVYHLRALPPENPAARGSGYNAPGSTEPAGKTQHGAALDTHDEGPPGARP